MSEERMNYLLEQAYHNYLYTDEVEEIKDYLNQLQQENQQLKEETEKLNHIIDKQDRDITTISNGNKRLNNVLDEIREWSKKKKQKMYKSRNQIAVYMLNDLLQILDKVKENEKRDNT